MKNISPWTKWLCGSIFLAFVFAMLVIIPIGHFILAHHFGGRFGVTALQKRAEVPFPLVRSLVTGILSVLCNWLIWDIALWGVILIGIISAVEFWRGYTKETREKQLAFTSI